MINIGYGIGKHYEDMKEYFKDNKINFDYLCDARYEELGSRYDNIPVISPDTLLHMKDIYVIVIPVEKNAKIEIACFLESSNIPWTFLSKLLLKRRNKKVFQMVEQAYADHSLENIEGALQDLESQILFDARLRMSLFNDCGELYQTLINLPIAKYERRDKADNDLLSTVRRLLTYQDTLARQRVILCEPSEESYVWIKRLNLKLDAIVGCKEEGKYFTECPVIDIDTAIKEYSDAVYISGSAMDSDIRSKLIAGGIPKENYKARHMGLNLNVQYFDEHLIQPVDHEIFVDVGSFDLSDTLYFMRLCNGKCDKSYALEPDRASYERCITKLGKIDESIKNKIELYHAAAWSSDTELSFIEQEFGSSQVCDNSETMVKARSIDSILQGEKVTYIKMDIEGAELEALKGAKESIKKWRPRLAICIYHKPEDVIELPAYILSLVSDYKMYIRHYSTCVEETVLYCI